MTQDEASLHRAVALICSGEVSKAAPLLAGLVRREPENAAAWQWLAACAPDADKQRFCLERSLEFDPQNQGLGRLLLDLQAGGVLTPADLLALAGAPPDDDGSDFITLTCPSCGGSLNATAVQDRLHCPNCGQEHLLRLRAGLEPALEKLQGVQEGVERAADELARQRLGEEIERLHVRQKENKQLFSRGGSILLTGIFVLVIYFAVVVFLPLLYLGAFLSALGLFYILFGLRNSGRIGAEIHQKVEEERRYRYV